MEPKECSSLPGSATNPLRCVLITRYEYLYGPVPISFFPLDSFGEDQKNKIALKAMILLARESTHGRVFPMAFEEIDAVALLLLDQMPGPPIYFAVLTIFDVRASMSLIDKFDALEKVIIEAGRNTKNGSNPEEVVRELYAKITSLATTSVFATPTGGEALAAPNMAKADILVDFVEAVKQLNEAVSQSDTSIPESIKEIAGKLNYEVTKLTEALKE
nr:hypothetical protein [Candidatus Njordarchaeota archaeon]